MSRTSNAPAALILCLSLASASAIAADKNLPVTKDTIPVGDGQSVAMKGSPLPLSGHAIVVGQPLPAAMVTAVNMAAVNVADQKGKVRILSVVPSVDTPVCEEQTHQLSEKTGALDKNVELVTISMDLPFAQARFAKEAKIKNVTFLSDYKSGEFGTSNGLLVAPLHLLARGLIVVDKDNIVRYVQVVPELTTLPDMAEAVKVAKSLL